MIIITTIMVILNMKKIILDTDFLIDCIRYKIDFIDEIRRISDFNYKMYMIDYTIKEMQEKPNFRLIKAILDANDVEIIRTEGGKKVDELILDFVDENCIVATQDQELKRKLKKKNISVITIRQKSYLVLT